MARYDKYEICKSAKAICKIMFACGYEVVTSPTYYYFDDEKDCTKTITTCDVHFINTNGAKSKMFGINIFTANTESIRLLCKEVLLEAINHQKEVKLLEGNKNEYAKALSGMHASLSDSIDSLNIDNFSYFTKDILEEFVKQHKGAKRELQSNLIKGIESLEEATKTGPVAVKNINDEMAKAIFADNYASVGSIELVEELQADRILHDYNPNAKVEPLKKPTEVMEVLKERNR